MKELTCIGCPRGCTLKIERDGDGWSVTGNTCPRGREFAVSEMTAPRRTICSTVRTAFPDAPVLPVRVSADIPKDRIFDVMDALKTVPVSERIGRGDVVIRMCSASAWMSSPRAASSGTDPNESFV